MPLASRPSELRRLEARSKELIDEPFLAGTARRNFTPYLSDFNRRIDLSPLYVIVEVAMRRYENDREASDAWLAPRVYACLRLSPREAADRGIWMFLALVAFPEYVRWRWTPREARRRFNVDRFVGPDNDQAFWRLWRAADLLRNGDDYSVCEAAMSSQDIPSTLMSLDLFHNRALAIACVRYVVGNELSGREINKSGFSRRLRAAAMTRSVDEIAPNPNAADPIVIRHWIAGVVDVDALLSDEVPTPDDEPVSDDSIRDAKKFLEEIMPRDICPG